MKWLKHLVDSGDDPDIGEAIVRFGPYGYYVFFRTLEVMAREFDVANPGVNTFPVDYLRKKYTQRWSFTRRALEFFSSKGRIKIEFGVDNGLETITLNCPKLRDLCDEYTQKQLKGLSGQSPDSHRDTIGIHSVSEEEVDSPDVPSASSVPSPASVLEVPLGDNSTHVEPQDRGSPIEQLTLNTGVEYPVYQDQVDEWARLYPAVDVIQELKNMRGWLSANPTKRKTANGVLRFVNSWLSKRQDSGGSRQMTDGRVSAKTAKTIDNLKDWRPPDDQ